MPARVLEIGAGRGYFLDKLAVTSTAVEYSEVSKCILRDKGYRVITRLSEIDGEAFDAVFMFQVLEHMDDIDTMMSAVSKLSRDVYVSVPNPARVAFNEASGSLIDMPPAHIGRWTRQALEAAWGRHAFTLRGFQQESESPRSFMELDLAYRMLRLAQLRNRRMRGRIRKLYVAATRIPTWLSAAPRISVLGATIWAHFSSV